MNKPFALLKKAVAAILVAALVLGLAACSAAPAPQAPDAGSSPASQTPAEANGAREITFWCNPYGDRVVQEELIKELTEQFYEESGISL